ncbi:MAG: SpoIIIAC/SpoIIIAD family protein [Eubacteriales bacterium]|nr:SpoIIIAC/SpoIIIAD family protein [Eubacteriales bacterium]
MEFVRVGAVALLGVLIAVQFKGTKQEYGTYLGVVICLLIFACTVAYMGQAEQQLAVLWRQLSSGSRYFALLFKVVGITWICEFVAGICRDSGFSAVAAQVELVGKIAILFAGMPVFLALAETIADFAG